MTGNIGKQSHYLVAVLVLPAIVLNGYQRSKLRKKLKKATTRGKRKTEFYSAF